MVSLIHSRKQENCKHFVKPKFHSQVRKNYQVQDKLIKKLSTEFFFVQSNFTDQYINRTDVWMYH